MSWLGDEGTKTGQTDRHVGKNLGRVCCVHSGVAAALVIMYAQEGRTSQVLSSGRRKLLWSIAPEHCSWPRERLCCVSEPYLEGALRIPMDLGLGSFLRMGIHSGPHQFLIFSVGISYSWITNTTSGSQLDWDKAFQYNQRLKVTLEFHLVLEDPSGAPVLSHLFFFLFGSPAQLSCVRCTTLCLLARNWS